jgi:hypothetical protein
VRLQVLVWLLKQERLLAKGKLEHYHLEMLQRLGKSHLPSPCQCVMPPPHLLRLW